MPELRPPGLCRSWLFLEGANEPVLGNAASSGADVLIQELAASAIAPETWWIPSMRPSSIAC